MRLLFGTVFALVIAAAIGLGGTWVALTRGSAYGGVTIGAWTGWPKNGTSGIDPYARAANARLGTLPIGLGDGVAFTARADDKGRPLDGRCDVLISGVTPAARYFTVPLYEPDGRLIENSLDRHGFTSEELVRNQDGSFEIAVAPGTYELTAEAGMFCRGSQVDVVEGEYVEADLSCDTGIRGRD